MKRRVILLLFILISTGFLVQQPDGAPIPGAWIGNPGNWLGATNQSGFFLLTDYDSDTVTVHATGFADWTGPVPGDGEVIVLQIEVLNTGERINVLASRGSLAHIIPSTEIITSNDLKLLSNTGLNRLNGRVPGVTVREYGGAMPVLSISLRGGDPSQSDYMVDGVSISSVRDGMPTGLFDPMLFSSLELARGGAVPGNGTSGSSGALNFLPPLSTEPLFTRISAESDGGIRTGFRFRGSALSLRRNIGAEGTVGYSGSFLTTGRILGLKAGILGGCAEGETEAPEWTIQGDGERKQGQALGWLNWSSQAFEADLSGGTGRMTYLQETPYTIDDTHTDYSRRLSLVWKGPVTVSLGYTGDNMESTSAGTHRRNRGMADVSYSDGSFTASARGIYYDRSAHVSGRAGLQQGISSLPLTFSCSGFTDYREPTMNDLYWPFDGNTSGNPDLIGERTYGAEAGVYFKGISSNADICGFFSLTDDLILWLPDENGIWTPSNISSSMSRGVELSGNTNISLLTISGVFTWNLATDQTEASPREGMLIPYRPEYVWGASMETELPLSLTADLHLSGMGKRFTNRTQSEYLEEYILLDGSLNRDLGKYLSVSITCMNITDENYQVTSGYPGKSRTFGIAINYTGE